MKLCINCKHVRLSTVWGRAFGGESVQDTCGHPTLLDPVRGESKYRCDYVRDSPSSTMCGSEGRLYEETKGETQ